MVDDETRVPDTTDDYTKAKLQLKFDTRYEFCLERGYIDPDEAITQADLRDILTSIPRHERMLFESRMARKMEAFDDIVSGERKTFDEPHIEHDDLIDDVWIPSFNARD